jgi:thiamine-monophosphate kinase
MALAEVLRAHASAAMDVSDGLVGDLAKLCVASRVTADIEVARVPLSAAASQALANDCNLITPILTGGEDYEILCTVAPANAAAFRAEAATAGVPVTEVGRIVPGDAPPRFLNPEGRALTFLQASYSHF